MRRGDPEDEEADNWEGVRRVVQATQLKMARDWGGEQYRPVKM